jgi:hypothetical protein
MELFHYIKQRSWTTVAGYLLFVGMMATGYYYNVTFVQLGLVDLGMAQQHTRPQFALGRFVRGRGSSSGLIDRRLVGFILLMFGIYFVDSLGFLRLIETPIYVETAWQSPNLNTRLIIGGIHLLGAWIAGILYFSLDEKALFYWTFGLFALVHFMYGMDVRLPPANSAPLAMPLLYSIAVSLYTVLNFALWADLSTPRTVAFNSALGVGVSGWAATFTSTALSIQWRVDGMPLAQHLNIVNAVALLFFVAMLGLAILQVQPQPADPPRTGDHQ